MGNVLIADRPPVHNSALASRIQMPAPTKVIAPRGVGAASANAMQDERDAVVACCPSAIAVTDPTPAPSPRSSYA